MQHRVAGAVGGGARTLGDAFAEIGRHAAERALIDFPRLGARERHAVMLEFDDRRDGLAAHVLDGVLVTEPIRALDGVVHVPAPIVRPHVAERRAHAALCRDRMAAGRKDLGDTGRREALGGHAEVARKPARRTDDDDVVLVFDRLYAAGME